ncbi:hypothetical protein Mapa_016936 [Marchantia paleacea]|nr:hypothetical protein Mapa_016936 [Marchantia paleacea]
MYVCHCKHSTHRNLVKYVTPHNIYWVATVQEVNKNGTRKVLLVKVVDRRLTGFIGTLLIFQGFLLTPYEKNFVLFVIRYN